MKRRLALCLLTMTFFSLVAQVSVRPLPEPGFEQRIRDFIHKVKVVDTHEHLLNPAVLDSSSFDFTLLISHYSPGDFRSSGMPAEIMDQLFSGSLTPTEKWNRLQPFWENSSNTAYCRAALLSADALFGIKDINENTVDELSEKIKNAYETDWYDQVLRQKCGIEYVVEDYPWDDWENHVFGDQKMFRYVRKFDHFILINSKEQLQNLTQWRSNGIHSLEDLDSALVTAFREATEEGIVAVKSILGYNRTLYYEEATKDQASMVFNEIINLRDGMSLPFNEVKPLQDYMMHRVLDLANDYNLPVQIHTGLNGGDIENSKPTHMINLFREYTEVKFILFHGAYPYGGELATLAKKFSNVYIDMCWLYIISPSYSEGYLHEWLETVPANKIMAFGGDFLHVEGVISHLLMAKQVVSNVLVDKVRDGYFSEEEAMRIAQMLFYDNAVRILKLKRS